MKNITEWVLIVLFCFCVGFFAHLGTNVAKKIWPSIPIELNIQTQE